MPKQQPHLKNVDIHVEVLGNIAAIHAHTDVAATWLTSTLCEQGHVDLFQLAMGDLLGLEPAWDISFVRDIADQAREKGFTVQDTVRAEAPVLN